MTNATILKQKGEQKLNILEQNWLKDKKLPLGLICIDDSLINNTLLDALKILPANFIIESNLDFNEKINNISANKNSWDNGFDFIVSTSDRDITVYMKNWTVPIVWKNHNISKLLNEFNASKVEWNAFLYDNDALCDIYYAIIRYLENFKFPYDNKALVKNVLEF